MDIAYYLDHPESLDDSTFHQLSKLVEEYPYYHAARLLLVKNAHKLQHECYEHELRKAAILLPDRKPLFDLAKAKEYEIPQKPVRKPAAPAKDRMAALIDGFLDKQKEGADSPTRMPTADPSADYMSYLFQQEAIAATVAVQYGVEAPPPLEQPTDRTQSLIEQFMSVPPQDRINLSDPEPSTSNPPEAEPATLDECLVAEGCYSESLAKICIQQGRYEHAIAILTQIHLNNPRKSAYFADQIRFLRKLAINNKYKS